MPFGVAVVPQRTRTINKHLTMPLSAGLPSSSIGRLRKSIDIRPTTCVFAGFCWNGSLNESTAVFFLQVFPAVWFKFWPQSNVFFFFAGSGSVVSNIPLKVDLRCSHVQSVEEPVSVFCF